MIGIQVPCHQSGIFGENINIIPLILALSGLKAVIDIHQILLKSNECIFLSRHQFGDIVFKTGGMVILFNSC